MKKILTVVLIVAMVLSSANFVFAELSSYSKSPTVQETPAIKNIEIVAEGENAPEISIVKNDDGIVQFYTDDGDGPAEEGCLVTLKVTPYVEKETIEEVVCKVTDGTSSTGEVSAENRLVYARTNPNNGTDGMGETNFKLWRDVINEAVLSKEDGAKEAQTKIKNKDLVIVSVFDVSVWCENPTVHDLSQNHCVHNIRLTFGDDEMSSLLNNYVSLMHFNRAGKWEYIPSKLYEDPVTKEDVIEFQIDCENLSPFAIAAFSSESGGDVPTSPQTGESFPVFNTCMAIICLGFAAFFFKKGKQAKR